MTSLYWPPIEEICGCIRTEAEELAPATLMAVHEPMVLRRVASRETSAELIDELQLLNHVINTNRPTPILGESGFGKSHVIRWLDIQLKRKNTNNEWHIVRIGKNSSIRQALTTLLDGLEGAAFDEARQKIDSVGRDLKTRTVAQHLIVFVTARLEELYDQASSRVEYAKANRNSIDDDEKAQIQRVRRHAKPSGLAALISDPYFNKQLIDKGKCFYQIAKRFTHGSSDEEIEENRFEVKLEDLNINTHVPDLSLEARTYVRSNSIDSSEESRQEAVDLLNECLSDACRTAFQQLFQFQSGSFQELFFEIRKFLKDENKTLFVLIEDMATISAIEDVLIDSLMQEDRRDGKQFLCPLHSAIAVTTGYQGYERRRDTLRTRAKYEWYIDRQMGTDPETYSRIEDFCGRYLNAARHGEAILSAGFLSSDNQRTWPGIWASEDEDEIHIASVFGESPKGFPLFPFSTPSLVALSNRYCKIDGKIEFNPRKILQHILREPLEEFRGLYVEGKFPPTGFADIVCPSNLIGELKLKVREDLSRAETLAAIWGYGAQTLAELAFQMPAPIAGEFGLESLAKIVEKTKGERPTGLPVALQVAQAEAKKQERETGSPKPISEQEERLALQAQIDEYFSNRSIPQEIARIVRSALIREIEGSIRDYSDWYGIKKWPELKQRKLPLINIPFNDNNPVRTLLHFGSEKEFTHNDSSLPYKQFIVSAVRRSQKMGDSSQGWDYYQGIEDYCKYKNFLDEWIPGAMQRLVELQREAAIQQMLERMQTAVALLPQIQNTSIAEKLNYLVTTSDALNEDINTKTGLEDWDQFIEHSLKDWDEKQTLWLDSFSTNRHALEGDLVKRELRGLKDLTISHRAARAAQKSQRVFLRDFSALELIDKCTTQQDYKSTLESLVALVSKLSSSGQFKGMDEYTTARRYKNSLKKIIESENWKPIKCALSLRSPFAPENAIKALQGIDLQQVRYLNDCLSIWKSFFAINLPRMKNENVEQGADKRKMYEDKLDQLITQFGEYAVAPNGKLE